MIVPMVEHDRSAETSRPLVSCVSFRNDTTPSRFASYGVLSCNTWTVFRMVAWTATRGFRRWERKSLPCLMLRWQV